MTSLTASYRLGYRSDVEGLRAVAILLVVAAHARLAHFAGGFVGVDVFFVLSGYLITGLLAQEIRTTGRLNLRLFYARRLRRLLPGLLLMLLCACLLGGLLLVPSEQMDQAGTAASAALWLSNFVFAFGNVDYFGASADSSLFLHTWSLGVEEQFYLVWPLLLAIAAGAWGRKAKVQRPTRMVTAMAVVLVLSLVLCTTWMNLQPLLAFYMMPARAWQFALGAIVFLLLGSPTASVAPMRDASGQRLAMVLHVCGWLGLVAILFAAATIDGNTPYPGAWALYPSLGAAAVLASGAHSPGNGIGRLLSLRPLQAIGRVSYAWYLWHWPILLLGATNLDMHSPVNRLALAGASLVVAAISYHGLEKPIRSSPAWLKHPGMAIAGAVVLMILGSALALRWQSSAELRKDATDIHRYEDARLDTPAIYHQGCDGWQFTDQVNLCSYGAADAKHIAMAIGDSVSLQWFPAYVKLWDKPDWRLIVATKSACPMVDEPIFYPSIGREFSECDRWRTELLRLISNIKPNIVVFGSAYTYAFSQTEWTEGTIRILDKLAPVSGHVFIIRATPTLGFNGPTCLEPRSWRYRKRSPDAACTSPAHNVLSDSVFSWLGQAAKSFNNVKMLDMTDVVCPQKTCNAERNGIVVFRDSLHLTATFAASLSPVLRQQLALESGDGGVSPSNTAVSPISR